MRIERLAVVGIAASLLALSDPTSAQSASDRPDPRAEFGVSVAAAPGLVFVAANSKQSGGRGPGMVYVYERRGSDWIPTGTLSAPHATLEDPFGVSMAADEKTLVVGAQFADVYGKDAGLAYVFERRNQNWQQAAVLSAADVEAGDEFGLTVSVSGDTIVVGARLESSLGESAGAAYVFEHRDGGWQQAAKLTASNPIAGDLFGRGSLDRQTMFVSADLNDDRGSQAGKAYLFERRGTRWTEVTELYASDAAAENEFGFSLALAGGVAVFGAVGAHRPGRGSGAAYVFERREDKWSETARLRASDAVAGELFGFAVSTSQDIVVVGAPRAAEGTGAVYLFERRAGAWTETAKLEASDKAPFRWFGSTVAVSGTTVVAGNSLDAKGANPGAAYVFEKRGESWVQVAKLTRP